MQLKSKKSVIYKHPELGVLNFYFNLRAMELFAYKQENEGEKSGLRMYATICLCALVANIEKNPTITEALTEDEVMDIFDEMEVDEFQNLKRVLEASMSDFSQKFDLNKPSVQPVAVASGKDDDKKK